MDREAKSSLTPRQAEMLLAPLGNVVVLNVTLVGTKNDVYRVCTGAHGAYYVKFHTAPGTRSTLMLTSRSSGNVRSGTCSASEACPCRTERGRTTHESSCHAPC
jgi:hypothetical protein